jgi:SAM-dependent methyltransferase
MNWTDGYVTDTEYVYDYQQELNPLRQRLLCLASGFAIPKPKVACELGFGQGLSINIHAAASAVGWWGTDFNPAQVCFAQQFAELNGLGARLFDQAFTDFCTRPDLPDFDVIGLHGIWSWISDKNRSVIVDFVKRRLRNGGVLYISYNTLPGWGPFAPVQHLLQRYAKVMSPAGHDAIRRIAAALDFVERLLDADPLYLRASPHVKQHLKQVREHDPRYLVHEYLNSDWNPMHVADVARWLEPTRCSFACSANYANGVDELNFSIEQQDLLRNIADPLFRETVRDFAINTRFRKDYWVKGPRRLTLREQAEHLRAERVILGASTTRMPQSVAGARAKVTASFFAPIWDVLADHRPRSLGDIEQAMAGSGVPFSEIVRAVMILAGMGHIQPVQDERLIEEVKPRTDRLNAHLIDRARFGAEVGRLASPVTGGGVKVSRVAQLFLLASLNGRRSPEDRAAFASAILHDQEQHVTKDGTKFDTAEDSLAELTKLAEAFAEQQMPLLQALRIG